MADAKSLSSNSPKRLVQLLKKKQIRRKRKMHCIINVTFIHNTMIIFEQIQWFANDSPRDANKVTDKTWFVLFSLHFSWIIQWRKGWTHPCPPPIIYTRPQFWVSEPLKLRIAYCNYQGFGVDVLSGHGNCLPKARRENRLRGKSSPHWLLMW